MGTCELKVISSRSIGWMAVAMIMATPVWASVSMTNWLSSDEIPLGDVGHTFTWWQTIAEYQAPSGAPQLDLDQYWLNVLVDGTIESASGNPLVDPWGTQYALYDAYVYSGSWAFELVDKETGSGGVIESGLFNLNAYWQIYDPYDPTSPFFADISGTFYANTGAHVFPNGMGPVDFSGLRFDFTGVYDVDSALLRFTLLGAPEAPLAVVPEPATSTLMAMAIVGLMLYARREHFAARLRHHH